MSMTLINSYTWPNTATSLDMFNIPQTFTDLLLFVSARTTAASDRQILLQFNGDALNHSTRRLVGNGSSAFSEFQGGVSAIIAGFMPGTNYTANTFANTAIYVPNYTSSLIKTMSAESVSENNATTAQQLLAAGSWNSTSAINRISLYINSDSYETGTSIALYGITKA